MNMRDLMNLIESTQAQGRDPLAPYVDLARRCETFEQFQAAIDPSVAGQAYRPRGLADAIRLRQEDGSLATYSLDAQKEWFGAYDGHSRYRTAVPKNGMVTIYRAGGGDPIKPGDYVTESRAYAQGHIENNLGGEGTIVSMVVSLDDLFPADGPHEFWYAPAALDAFKSLEDFYNRARQ